MLDGWSPDEIIDWLVDNDVSGTPELRQYGIAKLEFGGASAAAHTGSSTDDYKGHRVGTNYAIQGNILLGPAVLDSMESRFLNTEGDLACKLMAAMQGANMVGADSRCEDNGTSSLFAYLKVTTLDADMGDPSMLVSVRTHDGDGIEPIDSLQILFNEQNYCPPTVGVAESSGIRQMKVFPNPVEDVLTIDPTSSSEYVLSIRQIGGNHIHNSTHSGTTTLATNEWPTGVYIVQIETDKGISWQKVVKQ